MRHSFFFGSIAAIGLAMGFANPAHADYELCNATSFVLDAAIAYQGESSAHSQGWTRLSPGTCASALPGDVEYDTYYVFARSPISYDGQTRRFSGGERFCIGLDLAPADARAQSDESPAEITPGFAIDGRGSCLERGFASADFMRVLTETGASWKTTFTETADYSLKQAGIAGVQRLLQETGSADIGVDGIDGANTANAIATFRSQHGLSADDRLDAALFTKLVQLAEEKQRQIGLTICNRSQEKAWSAIAYEVSEDYESSGWLPLPANTCAKAVRDALGHRPYFIAAKRDNGPAPEDWQGTESFCVREGRFLIRGRKDCKERGYESLGFRRIETADEGLTTVNLSPISPR